jgi:Flp pilus assembly protein TadD/ferredoxin
MFLWPVVYRVAAGVPAPKITLSLTTSNLWANMPGWIIGGSTLVVVGFVCVYVLGAKGFCTYACPYGALMRVAEPLAPLRIRVTDACRQCASCTAACTSNVRVHEQVRDWGMVRDNDCMKCLDCVAACPNEALYLGFGAPAMAGRARVSTPAHRPWNVRWSEELVLAVTFVAGFFILRGLYGEVPFLMTLGAAGAIALLALVSVRLLSRSDVRFSVHRLKRGGRITVAGWCFTVLATLLAAALGHSAVVRYHEVRAESVFADITRVRNEAMDLGRRPGELAEGDRRQVDRLVHHIDRARSIGFFENRRLVFPRAWASYLAGDVAQSVGEATDAVRIQPGAAEVHHLLGRALVAGGRTREAVLAYAQAVELAPDRPEGFLYLGSLLAAVGDLDRALEVFRRGAQAFPEHADLVFNLGVAFAFTGQQESAVTTFKRVLEAHPGHRKARENLAGILAASGQFAEAERLLRSSLDAEPEDLALRTLLARVLIAKGDLQSAVVELETCRALDPESAEAKRLLDQLQNGAGVQE